MLDSDRSREHSRFMDWFAYMCLTTLLSQFSFLISVIYVCITKKENLRNYAIADLILQGIFFILFMLLFIGVLTGGVALWLSQSV